MPDKKLQQLTRVRTSILSGDQFAIGGADGKSYRTALTVLQDYLLEDSLTTSTNKAPQSAVVKDAIDAVKIQAVQNSLAAVTVNTFTPTAIATVNITPRSTSNVILLFATGDGNPNQAGGFNFLRLYRNSTALDPYIIIENAGATSVNQPFALSSIDAPATTNSITYTARAYQGSGSFTYGEVGNAQATRLIALEFAPA